PSIDDPPHDTAPPTAELVTLSLHDALPILAQSFMRRGELLPDELILKMIEVEIEKSPRGFIMDGFPRTVAQAEAFDALLDRKGRSEEHTSELQSLAYLVCRLLLEKKKKNSI